MATIASTFGVLAAFTPRLVNVGAVLPAHVRSGDAVRWTPHQIERLIGVLRAAGAARAEAAELAQIVHSESQALHVDPLYALALIKVESNFRAHAQSRQGAIGLLQVRPEAARAVASIGRDGARIASSPRLHDPRTNVALGLRYLQHLEGEFADRETALAAYNVGPTRLRRQLKAGKPLPREYADRVLATYRALVAAHARSTPATTGG